MLEVLLLLQRMFFWSTGFRVTRKYRVMRYKRQVDGDSPQTSESVDRGLTEPDGSSTVAADRPL